MQFVRALLLQRPGPAASAAWALAAVAAPTAARLLLDPLVADNTFATYFPFILLAAMALDWRYAVQVAVGSALVANYLFMGVRHELMVDAGEAAGTLLFFLSSVLVILVAATLRRAVRAVEDGRRREMELNRELQHRVRNTLSVVSALAARSFRGVAGAEPPLQSFIGRLSALAEANDVLGTGRFEVCRMPELARRALRPFASAALHMDGPPCALPPESAVPLVLALHELATNAAKYGALSAPGGRVELDWRLVPADGDTRLVLRWRERGGPPVRPPTRRGLGSRLLTAQAGLAAVTLDFPPEGATCEIVVAGAMPADATADAAPPAKPATAAG